MTAINTNQLQLAKTMWQSFAATANAFMTAKERLANEIKQAREYFSVFLADANGDELLAYKSLRAALRATMPKKLSDAQIAEISDDESISDVEKREAARLRKIIERFCNLIKDGKKQTAYPKKEATQAVIHSDEIPIEAAQVGAGATQEVERHASLNKVALSALGNAGHVLHTMRMLGKPIDHDSPRLQGVMELIAFSLDIIKGNIAQDKADDTLRMIVSKYQPK